MADTGTVPTTLLDTTQGAVPPQAPDQPVNAELVPADKPAVFFRGHIRSDAMDGAIVHQGAQNKTLASFTAQLDKCIGQSWIKLASETRSNVF